MDETEKRVEVPMDKVSPGDRTYPARISVARLSSGRTSKRYNSLFILFNHHEHQIFRLIIFLYDDIFLQSILRQANFKGAKLLGASFFDADLTGFCSLFLCWSRIKNCKWEDFWFMDVNNSLSHCNSGADLSETDLRGADFSLANVTKVILDDLMFLSDE